MTDTTEYTPPKVWTWEKPNGGQFANANRPTAGLREEKELPIGITMTPNRVVPWRLQSGSKVTFNFPAFQALLLQKQFLVAHHLVQKPLWLLFFSQ